MSPDQETFDRAVLMEREREFEQQFLTRPLLAAPHDEEIARRATMFVANHPGTRFIRYFTRGWFGGEPEEIGAFVIGETISDPIEIGPFGTSKNLVAQLLDEGGLSADLCRAIWETLLAPVVAGARGRHRASRPGTNGPPVRRPVSHCGVRP